MLISYLGMYYFVRFTYDALESMKRYEHLLVFAILFLFLLVYLSQEFCLSSWPRCSSAMVPNSLPRSEYAIALEDEVLEYFHQSAYRPGFESGGSTR